MFFHVLCPDVSVFKGSGIRIAIAPKKIINNALRFFSEFRRKNSYPP